MRLAHRLKENKRSERWQRLCFVRVLTQEVQRGKNVKELVFVHGAACLTRADRKTEEWKQFDKPQGLWKWITGHAPQRQRLVVFVYNLYQALKVTDGHVRLPHMGWTATKYFFAESSPTCFIHFKKGRQSILLLDVLNYFTESMEELAKLAGLKEEVIKYDLTSREAWEYQAERDVNIIARVITRYLTMITDEDLGNPGKTIAAQAWNAYRHRFMDASILIHNREEVIKLEIAAYTGGRAECYQVGTFHGEFYKLDMNSMYPYVMTRHRFPRRLVGFQRNGIDPAFVRLLIDKWFCIAECDIETDTPLYPFRSPGRVIYPVGQFKAALAQDTLAVALDRGDVRKITKLAIYAQERLFIDYVEELWRRRQEAQQRGDFVYALVWKKLLNSLYGKFGQRMRPVVSKRPARPDEFRAGVVYAPEGKQIEWVCFGTATRFSHEREVSRDAFPAISAAVTDYARLYLWDMMERAGWENLYYVDTDCLIVNVAGFEALKPLLGPNLGQLKVEATGSYLQVRAAKDYTLGDDTKRKGVRPQAVYNPDTDEWEQEQFERFRGGLLDAEKEGYRVHTIRKRLARDVLGREVMPDGTTRPLVMGRIGESTRP